MIVRALTATGDWTFGKGLQDYKSGVSAVSQNIQTRLSSFLGDCFFDQNAGIDWFNFCGGSKSELAVNLAVSAVILNTQFVTGLVQLSLSLNRVTRRISISYTVTTSITTNQILNLLSGTVSLLLTEAGDVLTSESGEGLEID